MPGRSKSKASPPAKPAKQTKANATAPRGRKKAASPSPPPSSPSTPSRTPTPEPKAAKKGRTSKAASQNAAKSPARKKQKQDVLSVNNFVSPVAADLVLTCGNGDTGQLGHGEDVTVAKRPRHIKSFPEGVKFLQAVAGGMHTAVLTSTHEVFTCGCNDEGALGRVCCDDDGSPADKDEDFIFRKVPFPEGTSDIVMISAGDSHTAALTRDGSVFIWGIFRDKGGAFGLALQDQKTVQVLQKTKEPFLLSSKTDRIVVKIASGADHIAMLTEDGKIFTSGAGDAGQLGRLGPHSRERAAGQRTVAKMMTPALITTRRSFLFNDVWCATYCCFARSVVGKIYAWGLNNYKQLGVDSTDPSQTEIHFPMVSQQFSSAKVWKSFDGNHHVLAVDSTGTCYGLGRGTDCRLGQGANNENDAETLVEIASNGIIGVAAATGTSFCWNSDGRGFAWGLNNEAELGLAVEEGSKVEKPTEIEIRSVQGCRIIHISANAQHTVFLATRTPEPDGAAAGNAA